MQRIPYVDGLRGYLIYSMTLAHFGVIGANGVSWAQHKSFSVFFTGEGFMAISGLMVGYISYRSIAEEGLMKGFANSFKRSWKILRYYVVVFLLCAAPLLVFDLHGDALVSSFFRNQNPLTIEAFFYFLIGIYRPLMFDILYLYILFIALSPIIVALVIRSRTPLILGVSFFLWVSAQYGLVEKVNFVLATLITDEQENLFGSFPILAWQFPFTIGVLIGCNVYKQPEHWLKRIEWLQQYVFASALAIVCVFAIFRVCTSLGIISLGFVFFSDYLMLAPETLFNFVAFSIVLVCILQSEATANTGMRSAKRAAQAILTNKVLTVIGANTLLTFSGSVVLTYWVVYLRGFLGVLGPPLVINTAVFLGALLLLYLLALGFSWVQQR